MTRPPRCPRCRIPTQATLVRCPCGGHQIVDECPRCYRLIEKSEGSAAEGR
jgi:hypothetical protein